MSKLLSALAIAIAFCSLAPGTAIAQETVHFDTQLDQDTADFVNDYFGTNSYNTEDYYYACYTVISDGKRGGQKVRFSVFLSLIDVEIFGEGNLNASGTQIDAGKATLRDYDLFERIRSKLRLPVYAD